MHNIAELSFIIAGIMYVLLIAGTQRNKKGTQDVLLQIPVLGLYNGVAVVDTGTLHYGDPLHALFGDQRAVR